MSKEISVELQLKIGPNAKDAMDKLSQVEMARLHRFAPSGHPYFSGAAGDYFQKRFKELGGMTTEISKSIGWGDR